ncbi:aminopeptidase P family N-terminal domain-containing protein, partial [Mesorhizobium ciceri]
MDFPVEEYKTRLQRTQEEMAKHDLDVLLLHQPENIQYLTGLDAGAGFFSYHAVAVPSHRDPVLILR